MMPNPLQTHRRRRDERRAHREYELAKAEASGTGQMVVGVILPDGCPTYFTAARETPNEVLEAKVFEVYHGRPPEKGEVALWRMAQARKTTAVA